MDTFYTYYLLGINSYIQLLTCCIPNVYWVFSWVMKYEKKKKRFCLFNPTSSEDCYSNDRNTFSINCHLATHLVSENTVQLCPVWEHNVMETDTQSVHLFPDLAVCLIKLNTSPCDSCFIFMRKITHTAELCKSFVIM